MTNELATGQEAEKRINALLWNGAMTRFVRIGSGALATIDDCISQCFQEKPVVIIADSSTYLAAGQAANERLHAAGRDVLDPFLFEEKDLYAEYRFVEQLETFLRGTDAIPIAVGSGTINDLTKLASHQTGRPYMVVGTAASMDGYTAFGASITRDGYKQTMACPAPLAVVIDLDVIANAPPGMNAAGYADLIAKVPAGADWILADWAGVEPIDPDAWGLVQPQLRTWLGDPAGIRRGDRTALAGLVEGLIMTGLGMQRANSSRPASGADHQFSHLWDMQHHTHHGATPLHGFKVAIGTLASAAMYEWVLAKQAEMIATSPSAIRDRWPSWDRTEQDVRSNFANGFLAEQVLNQCRTKYMESNVLGKRLERLKSQWDAVSSELSRQLLPAKQIQSMLADAGAPHTPEAIGISRTRLRTSFGQAQKIRSRYTILDFLLEAGWWDHCITDLFEPGGFFHGS
ncbi:MAG: sn-glycerol-1-phosphate dehydrogenase [Pirellulales bacterium]|nr:sn-glycerol-1-phosphate dehydrogenase [Pirellulales bacterium]